MVFFKNEDGSTSVEIALLFPFILALIMFALYINMNYEAKIATSIGANEGLRYAVTQTSYADAKEIASNRVKDVYKQHNIVLEDFSLTYVDANHDNKYSIGDTLILNVKTKKGLWSHFDYKLTARVEDDLIVR